MSEVRITAEVRTEFGKGGARRTRRAGKIPAVLYGHGEDPRHISIQSREFVAAIKGGANTLLTLEFDGITALALPKAIQRDPVRDTYEHIDLLIVRRGERVTVDVPVVLTGEPAPDTLVNQDLATLSIEVEATVIPESVTIDIQGATISRAIHASDVRLPTGAVLLTDPEALVVGFLGAPTAEQLEAELAEAEAEVGIEREPTDVEQAEEAAAAEAESEGEGTDGAASGDADS
ncbi:MAG: 50S ribosomal protein L25/general stress protein Ctc [Geodermatophilaceae bacterium]|nr:50S ribosomal protein L25/general stress protein Ctc [Geodermatophilaceae bacterium]